MKIGHIIEKNFFYVTEQGKTEFHEMFISQLKTTRN